MRTKFFCIRSIPITTLDTSIPEAMTVSSVPKTALLENARIIGMDKVSMNPMKKVMTEVIITSTSTHGSRRPLASLL